MGLLGAIAFWSLLGLAIVYGCRLARSVERELAVVGAVVVAMVVAYAFEGHTDQGFFYYRVAFVMGTLLGLAEAARRMLPPEGRRLRAEPARESAP
jgi:peptidoglycan/LPS O-acetylase OafA/YrhL